MGGFQPPFTASLSTFPALNDIAFEDGIATVSPVLSRFLPERAARFVVNVPNPGSLTASSLHSASVIGSSTVSTARSAPDLLSPILSAKRPAMSDLFIPALPATVALGGTQARPA